MPLTSWWSFKGNLGSPIKFTTRFCIGQERTAELPTENLVDGHFGGKLYPLPICLGVTGNDKPCQLEIQA